MITKLSVLFQELTTSQLIDVAEWLTTKGKPTLPERIQAYLEKHGSATLNELKDRLRVNNGRLLLDEVRNLVDHGVIERYSAGDFKTKYRVKK